MKTNDWGIYSIGLNKKHIDTELLQNKIGKKRIYNFLARYILEKIDFSKVTKNVNLVVDRSKSSKEIKDFNEYVENQLYTLLPLNTKLYITHELSHENTGLQAVDMFCWGMARKLLEDTEWYDLFKENIRFQAMYLPQKKDDPFNT